EGEPQAHKQGPCREELQLTRCRIQFFLCCRFCSIEIVDPGSQRFGEDLLNRDDLRHHGLFKQLLATENADGCLVERLGISCKRRLCLADLRAQRIVVNGLLRTVQSFHCGSRSGVRLIQKILRLEDGEPGARHTRTQYGYFQFSDWTDCGGVVECLCRL